MKKQTKTVFKKFSIVLITMLLCITSLSLNPLQKVEAEIKEVEREKEILNFKEVGVHDPSIIKANGSYYIFGSHMTLAKSNDLKNWDDLIANHNDVKNHTLFGDISENFKEVLTWAGIKDADIADRFGIWAPDVYHNAAYENADGTTGAYLMYISVTTGKENGEEHYRSAIALATSKNIEGPYLYQETVLYSGFTNVEGVGNWEQTDFKEYFPSAEPRSGYFNNGKFNFNYFPNAIDPSIVDGKDGELFMTYGSWNGGIYVVELDRGTGKIVRSETYTTSGNFDGYFGTRITGGFRTSGEGPYIQYNKETGYYDYYVTYGGLTQGSDYNMRYFRSKNIMGPYEDSKGTYTDLTQDNRGSYVNKGNLLLGSFEFLQDQSYDSGATAYDYRVPGHNSVIYEENGEKFIVFHTRFKNTGEQHQVRVHQLFFNDEGWPVIAPQRYNNETKVTEGDLSGTYSIVKQKQNMTTSSKLSEVVSLNSDKTVSGSSTGTWSFESGVLVLNLADGVYKGYVLEQSTQLTAWHKDFTFTLIGESGDTAGHSILGIRTTDKNDEEIVNAIIQEQADLLTDKKVLGDIALPKRGVGGSKLTWTSSELDLISSDGVVNLDRTNEEDVNVTLTLSVSLNDVTITRNIPIVVTTTLVQDYVRYTFDETLEMNNVENLGGKMVTSNLGADSTLEPKYEEGIVLGDDDFGKALVLNGESALKLPNDIIHSDAFSVSFWFKPDKYRQHGASLFMANDFDRFLSIPMLGHNNETIVWSNNKGAWFDGITNTLVPLHAWSHLTLVVDGSNLRFYVDGKETVNRDNFTNIFNIEDAINTFAMGGNFWSEASTGLLDDLRIYPERAISTAEVERIYDKSALKDKDLAELIFEQIALKNTVVSSNIDLPTLKYGQVITWTSSNSNYITNEGVVTLPEDNASVEVTLNASFDINGITYSKDYLVEVVDNRTTQYHYTFDDSINDKDSLVSESTLTGNRIDFEGGSVSYRKGRVGKALYLDGQSGVRLADDLIASNQYSVQFWMNPEVITSYTSVFFGDNGPDWMSYTPRDIEGNSILWTQPDFRVLNAGVITANEWTHISITNEYGVMKLYVNGEKVAEIPDFPNLFEDKTGSRFSIGVNAFPDAAFHGMIDDLIVSPNSVVSAEDIKSYVDEINNQISPEELAAELFDSFNIKGDLYSNISLPSEKLGIKLNWSSSNVSALSNTGVVTRPKFGAGDIPVTLKLTIEIDGEEFTHTYSVNVKELENEYHYEFDGSLSEKNSTDKSGKMTGDFEGNSSAKEVYGDGITGKSLYFDGDSGVRLPNNIINSNTYSVQFWLNPEETTEFTTTFFGYVNNDKWLSFTPFGPGGSAVLWSGTDWFDGIASDRLENNTWTHVGFSVDNGKLHIYMNGELTFESDQFKNLFSSNETNIFTLGMNAFANDLKYQGYMDDLVVYPGRVRTANEFKEYYDRVIGALNPENIADIIFDSITFGENGLVTDDLVLPDNRNNQSITWKTSDAKTINLKGSVTRPKVGESNKKVVLTAKIVIDGVSYTRDYTVLVMALQKQVDGIHYTFDKTLSESSTSSLNGKITRDRIDAIGGTAQYRPGISNDALYLDGTSGLRLPDGIIKGNKYSVSFWVNPDEITPYSTTFFGAETPSSWISFVLENNMNQSLLWSGEQWYDGLIGSKISEKAWSHVVFTVDEGHAIVYLNGNKVHEGKDFPSIFGKGDKSVFGLGVNYWDTPFKGMFDDLIVQNGKVMSQKEINAYRDQFLENMSAKDVAELISQSFQLGVNGVVTTNLNLPKKGLNEASIRWATSNKNLIDENGKVTRPAFGLPDGKVTLSAYITIGKETFKYTFDLIVKANTVDVDKLHFDFENSLEDTINDGVLAEIIGDKLLLPGGNLKYTEGKIGQGLHFDGKTGLRLPEGLIKGNTYSVSFWMKPERYTDHTPSLFMASNDQQFLSIPVQGWNKETFVWSNNKGVWYDGFTGMKAPIDMWTHMSLSVDKGRVNLYINGELKHTGTNFNQLFSEAEPTLVALGVNYWDEAFVGVIDELMINTSKTMSAKEVLAYYDETVGDDRFMRNRVKSLELNFEGKLEYGYATGDRLDTGGGSIGYEEGVIDQAGYFNGSSGVRLPDGFLSSDTYSVQMWLKPEEIMPFTTTFFAGMSPQSWISAPISGVDNKTMLWSGEMWYDAKTPKTLPKDYWSHLAFTVDKGAVTVYIDGEVEYSGKDFPDIFNGPNSFAGLGVNFWDAPYKGLMDEVKVYNSTKLSSGDIKAYYEETKPEQEEFERNQEKTHHFTFDDVLSDLNDELLVGEVIGDMIDKEGGTLTYVEGRLDKAIYLDGSTGIQLPKELITSENYSVALWIKPEAITAHTTTFFGAQTEASWLSVIPESGEYTKGNSMIWSGTEWFDGNLGTQVLVDEWAHIAFTVEQGELVAYLNGVEVFRGEGFPDIFTDKDSVFTLGVNYWDQAFQGSIDDVRVYDSEVLDAASIALLADGIEIDVKEEITEPVVDEIVVTQDTQPTALYIAGGIGAVLIALASYVGFFKKEEFLALIEKIKPKTTA